MRTELVSVIMPCYNDGIYLREAISSIMNQTYRYWELIIIDDGSNDLDTLRELNRINHPKITIIMSVHKGVVKSRNTGISISKGKYIVPVDADDIAEPTMLEKYVDVISNQRNVGIVYCIYQYFGLRSGIYRLPQFSMEQMLISNCINNSSLFRRDDWERAGGYNANMEIGCEDYDLWLTILGFGREAVLVPEVLLHYRVKKNRSRTTEIDENREMKIYENIINNHEYMFQQNWKSVILLQKELIVKKQLQIDNMYREKYRLRRLLYKSVSLYRLLHPTSFRNNLKMNDTVN